MKEDSISTDSHHLHSLNSTAPQTYYNVDLQDPSAQSFFSSLFCSITKGTSVVLHVHSRDQCHPLNPRNHHSMLFTVLELGVSGIRHF